MHVYRKIQISPDCASETKNSLHSESLHIVQQVFARPSVGGCGAKLVVVLIQVLANRSKSPTEASGRIRNFH